MHGGTSLSGSINISGSKNASLPILAAALLTDQQVVIERVPDVSDTNYMLQILSALGCEVERYSGTVKITAAEIRPEAPYEIVRKMRASICVMGPLVARLGRASVSIPGGCVIGDRPIDLHLKGLQAIGANIDTEGGNILIEAKEGLKGQEVDLSGKHGPTVLGTRRVRTRSRRPRQFSHLNGSQDRRGRNPPHYYPRSNFSRRNSPYRNP